MGGGRGFPGGAGVASAALQAASGEIFCLDPRAMPWAKLERPLVVASAFSSSIDRTDRPSPHHVALLGT